MARYFETDQCPEFGDNLVSKIRAICPFVFLICYRNKNKNIVVYQLRVQDGKLLDPPIESYWLIFEESYQQARRKQNIQHNREELSYLDHLFAWGFNQQRISDKEASFSFKNHNHPMVVKLINNEACLFTNWKDKKYMLRSLWIDTSDEIKLLNIQDNVRELSLSGLDITEKNNHKPSTIFLKSPKK